MICLSLQHPQEVEVESGEVESGEVEGGTVISRPKLRVVPPIRAVKQLATVGAALRETASLPQAATVM